MEYLVGIVLALVVAVFARVTGPGSSRRAWPRTACSTCCTGWWWPGFCLTYDVGAAAFLAWLLLRAKLTEARLTSLRL